MTHPTPFARRARHLGLTVAQAARIVGVPTRTAESWSAGRYAPPRSALRLLALWGRLNRNRANGAKPKCCTTQK
jgi:hypothetical protein